jgi:ABC-type nickel/cobalt efflux system permease component RcnA
VPVPVPLLCPFGLRRAGELPPAGRVRLVTAAVWQVAGVSGLWFGRKVYGNDATPWWVTSLSSLVISLLVFGLGYWLVYRRQIGPQLRHLEAQAEDRHAALMAQQAAEARQLALTFLAWYPRGTAREDAALWTFDLPEPDEALNLARLANDQELRCLLEQVAADIPRLKNAPDSRLNVVLMINRDEELRERLGTVDGVRDEAILTTEQAEFLAPHLEKWHRDMKHWREAADRVNATALRLRDRAELLLRQVPAR